MNRRLVKTAAGLGAIAAMAFGGVALASGGTTNGTPAPATVPAVDQDNIEDANGNDDATEPNSTENEADEATEGPEAVGGTADTDNLQDENGADDATEQDGAEDEGSEPAEVPGDDGPGGHADEPTNPNADHQYEGAE